MLTSSQHSFFFEIVWSKVKAHHLKDWINGKKIDLFVYVLISNKSYACSNDHNPVSLSSWLTINNNKYGVAAFLESIHVAEIKIAHVCCVVSSMSLQFQWLLMMFELLRKCFEQRNSRQILISFLMANVLVMSLFLRLVVLHFHSHSCVVLRPILNIYCVWRYMSCHTWMYVHTHSTVKKCLRTIIFFSF